MVPTRHARPRNGRAVAQTKPDAGRANPAPAVKAKESFHETSPEVPRAVGGHRPGHGRHLGRLVRQPAQGRHEADQLEADQLEGQVPGAELDSKSPASKSSGSDGSTSTHPSGSGGTTSTHPSGSGGSTKRKEPPTSESNPSKKSQAPEKSQAPPADSKWTSGGNLGDHYLKHGHEFPKYSMEDYGNHAAKVAQSNSPETEHYDMKDGSGKRIHYDKPTNTYVVTDGQTGKVITSYKPTAGEKYFKKQKERDQNP